jgi:site-specific DNA-adenine methylase
MSETQCHEASSIQVCSAKTGTTSIPSFSYPGGKARLANTIISFMPKSGGIYAEPFAGRGNVFFRAASTLQYSCWLLNDLRTDVFFRALLSHGNSVTVPAHTREEFERQKAARLDNDTTAILMEPYMTFSGGGYSAGYRSKKGSPLQHLYQHTLRRAHQILTDTQPTITNVDWEKVVSDLGEDDFAYLDPPYFDAKVHGYRPTDINYDEMVELLKNARFRWLLSEYCQPIYLQAFGKPFWQREVQLRATNFRHDGGKERRTECLWRNY